MSGDSRTRLQEYAMGTTSPTFVRASGVVTANLGQAHNLVTNNQIYIENLADAGGTNDFTGWFTITRTGTNTFTYPDARPDATASWGSVNGRSSGIYNEQYTGFAAWFEYTNALYCNAALRNIKNVAFSGAKIADQLANMSVVVAQKPDLHIAGPLGVNDLNTRTLAQMYADTLANYAVLQAAGIPIVHISEVPFMNSGSGGAIFSAANVVKQLEFNKLMESYCAVTPGMEYVDAYSLYVDPLSSPAGQAKANYTKDGLHPSPWSCRQAIAPALGPVLQKLFPAVPSRLPSSNADNFAYSSTSNNLTSVGWASTAGGSTSGSTATITGLTVCANMQVVATGPTATCTGAPTLRADGFGYDQVCVFTAGASGDALAIYGENISTSGKANVNDLLTGRCAISLAGVSGSKLKQFQISLVIDDNVSINSYSTVFTGSGLSSAIFGTDDFSIPIKMPQAIVHSTAGHIRLSFSCSFDGAGTALTVKFGRQGIIKNET
ncbi:MAG: SGNH/GDSL hydrolase family protein [Alphaproteobacteria bacterium]|nr:SGNH/GDSL hydrolase family protein [Alphaproteobacteria bacterium]